MIPAIDPLSKIISEVKLREFERQNGRRGAAAGAVGAADADAGGAKRRGEDEEEQDGGGARHSAGGGDGDRAQDGALGQGGVSVSGQTVRRRSRKRYTDAEISAMLRDDKLF